MEKLGLLALLVVLLSFPSINAASFSSDSFASSVSLGGIYNVIAYTNDTVSNPIPCYAYFQDYYNNTVKGWTADSNFNAIKVNTDGYVKTFVKIDDAFLRDQNYTFTLTCGNYTSSKQVYMDVAGDYEMNRLAANFTGYFTTHPEQVIVGLLMILLIISAAKGGKNFFDSGKL